MKPIETEEQYLVYLRRLEENFLVGSDLPNGDPLIAEINEIAALVQEYEEKHYPIRTTWWLELNVFLFDVKYQFRRIRKKLLQSKPTKLNTAL
jgi:antitoxin component HigA of HigAB toxin-antitoxin module